MIYQTSFCSVICFLLIAVAICDDSNWDSRNDANILRYHSKTNQVEDNVTPVWQKCRCDYSSCDCFIEYIAWNNGSKEARLYFRVDPNVPKKLFRSTVYDNNAALSETFQLNDGITCKTFKNGVFDKFCMRTYGRASYSNFNRICLQVGVIIRRDNVISSDLECIKAWPEGVTHMQPSSYENPSLSDLNHHLYKLRYSAAPNIGKPSLVALIVLSTVLSYRML